MYTYIQIHTFSEAFDASLSSLQCIFSKNIELSYITVVISIDTPLYLFQFCHLIQ